MIKLGLKVKEMETTYSVNRSSNSWRNYYFNHNLGLYPEHVTLTSYCYSSYPNLPTWINRSHQESGWWGYYWEPASSDELNTILVGLARETNGSHGYSTRLTLRIFYR